MRYRRQISPLLRLIIEMRALARHYDQPAYHAAARCAAETLPPCFAERMPGTIKGSIAKQARKLMIAMGQLPGDERVIAAETLRGFADILSAPNAGEILNDSRPGRTSRRRASAGP